MIRYVAGFLMSDQRDQIALVVKNRPEWQAGLHNAIGGKVEPGEFSAQAMAREFLEEAGVLLEWSYAFTLRREGSFEVNFYTARSSEALAMVRSVTDEQVVVVGANDLPSNIVGNLRWIIPMLLDQDTKILPQIISVE